jgi:hypothetical protein
LIPPWLAGLSGRRRRATRWPPSAAPNVHAVFPHTAFTKTRDSKMQRKGNKQVGHSFHPSGGSGLQYPPTMTYGFFAKRPDPPHHPYSADYPSLPFCLRLPPSPTHSVADHSVTRLSPRLRYYLAVRLLTELRSPLRFRL